MIKKVPTKTPGIRDKKAIQEEKAFSFEELEAKAKINEKKRKENFRWHFNLSGKIFFWTFSTLICGGVIIVFYHLLLPPCAHFLPKNQLSDLHKLIFAAMATTFVKDFYKNHF